MKEGDILTDGTSQYKVLSVTGGIFWLSLPGDFSRGFRMFTAEDLAAAGIHA